MYVLTVTYPNSEGASFDFDHFREKHLSEVGKAFKPFGLGYAAVLRGEEALDGGEPAYFAMTILSFPTEQNARDAVKSKAGKALAKDIAKFTSVTPVMQFNRPVE